MYKLNGVLGVFVALIVTLFFTSCEVISGYESSEEYFDDAAITAKVKLALDEDSSLKSAKVNVITFKRVVQLCGIADSKEQADKMVKNARKIKGVRSVRNNLMIRMDIK
jgi:hyperosmotically inducible periplasmic protein